MSADVKRNPFPGLARIEPDRTTEPFWQAARAHRLVCQRCEECGTYRHPPLPYCWKCNSDRASWPEVPGTGTVYSYSVVNYTISPDVKEEDLPYVVVVVELDGTEGNKHVSNLVGTGAMEVSIGDRVVVTWDDISDLNVTVPRFRLEQPR